MRKIISKMLAFCFLLPAYLAFFRSNFLVAAFLSSMISGLIIWVEAGIHLPNNSSFIDRVKVRLGLSFVNVSVKQRNRKGIIGGFVVPLLPFFVRISYNDKNLKAESIIHELTHIYFFVHRFQLVVIFLLAYLFSIINVGIIPVVAVMISFLCFQEYLAFNETKHIAGELGLTSTREFDIKLIIKYILVYSVFMAGAYLSFGLLGHLAWWICLIILVAFIKIMDILMSLVFDFIDDIVRW